ncbi:MULTISPECIES: transglutaminase-like domain-containing protein [unclassified Campylobacter]|uniref:transglutaminase-like domain-containing protein n=1 Tax=unclassified Campylobacter TaxID=2593542 RepID=UPI0022EA039E|nr:MULTISPECIES: transglutaminase-like domain-containing protein [unclassified Campylobacter]MDA3053988.1 transglutaminase-like domain-containing protein [Campylobacter sp. VBCF_07 NA4]MDA3060125.1 transglutaminase-like domain-containing protein [Campylobacter sp. VBCF_02 NA5]MDA3069639.1 transglutaminase-like domain-containing protein [Campylobacter sp. VBCF_08 NA3]WBR55027.1 transglutaminase-like domain-containing protein [Campylobacter sp. VBCF_01 NA2]
MKRRDFFKFSSILGVASFAPSVVLADVSAKEDEQKTRKFSVSLKHAIKEVGKESRVWVPLVLPSDFQQVISHYKVGSNAVEKFITEGEIPTYYAKFSGSETPILDISFDVQTTERNTDFSKVNFNENEKLAPEIAKFLQPTTQIQIDGVVKQKSDEIVGNIKGDLEKARAIYTWVANTMERDNSVLGCGLGDVKQILSSGKLSGKCTDINSVFVALARAAGIPAREMFGIRVGASRFSSQMGAAPKDDGFSHISGGQHCRAEFYLKGYGWIPVDPADVTKVRLGEKLTNDDQKIAQIREYLFGNWEMCWIGFNYGRDFTLSPRPAQFPINNFGYVYGETDGQTLNYYDPKEFSYDYKSREI